MNGNLIFNWRRRFASASGPAFVPAVVVGDASSMPPEACHGAADDEAVRGGRMEIVCRGGRRIVLGPDFDALALGRLLAVVED